MSNETPPVEMKMQPSEFAELRAGVAALKERDVHLGRFLELLLLHLGHAHGLDPAVEDARHAKKAKEDGRAAEDTRLKDEAEARAKLRTAEDAQPRTPLEQEQLQARRAAEDIRVKADADALAKAREEEDARQQAADEHAATTAQSEPAARTFAPAAPLYVEAQP